MGVMKKLKDGANYVRRHPVQTGVALSLAAAGTCAALSADPRIYEELNLTKNILLEQMGYKLPVRELAERIPDFIKVVSGTAAILEAGPVGGIIERKLKKGKKPDYL